MVHFTIYREKCTIFLSFTCTIYILLLYLQHINIKQRLILKNKNV